MRPVIRRTVLDLRRLARVSDPAMFWAGCLLVASGLVHLGIWLVDGSGWTGPLAWRKPILFGLSAGVTLISLAHVLPCLGWRGPPARWFGRAMATATLAEVALITMQTWRGVPSHYNTDTLFDTIVFHAMGWLILAVTAGILITNARVFGPLTRSNRPTPLSGDMALAIRVGLTLLSLSCLIGVWMIAHGEAQIARDLPPGQVGERGVAKFLHGVPMHAIQALPLMVYALQRLRVPQTARRSVVGYAAVATMLFTVYAAWQTLTGHPRWGVNPVGVVLLIATSVAGALAAWPVARHLMFGPSRA